ncbi:lipid asymmetry maintenance protein MlaB [Rhodoferax sp. U11-2br]|uniref:STAS domain-containing protein n=1 Tax=Rhodoferax sp. U11-2br TaxID=2838878 RepID=UPI001BE755A1|nr:STAS domain-containing protein [Rhodoferax sp. U11-2br]MBT3065187.1 STAS domain-containing protein [Rhodoferax sp. U11-2br]
MSAPTVLKIEGELTIFRAAELKPMLLDAPAVTEVDLSAVTELDTAGLQLLMVAKKAALAQGRELQLTGHSPAVLDVLALLNVAADLGDQTVTDSPALAVGTRS